MADDATLTLETDIQSIVDAIDAGNVEATQELASIFADNHTNPQDFIRLGEAIRGSLSFSNAFTEERLKGEADEKAKRQSASAQAVFQMTQQALDNAARQKIDNLLLQNAATQLELDRLLAEGIITEEQYEELTKENEEIRKELLVVKTQFEAAKENLNQQNKNLDTIISNLEAKGLYTGSFAFLKESDSQAVVLSLEIPSDTAKAGRYLVNKDENGDYYVMISNDPIDTPLTDINANVKVLLKDIQPAEKAAEAIAFAQRQEAAGRVLADRLDDGVRNAYSTLFKYIARNAVNAGIDPADYRKLLEQMDMVSLAQTELREIEQKIKQLEIRQQALDLKVKNLEISYYDAKREQELINDDKAALTIQSNQTQDIISSLEREINDLNNRLDTAKDDLDDTQKVLLSADFGDEQAAIFTKELEKLIHEHAELSTRAKLISESANNCDTQILDALTDMGTEAVKQLENVYATGKDLVSVPYHFKGFMDNVPDYRHPLYWDKTKNEYYILNPLNNEKKIIDMDAEKTADSDLYKAYKTQFENGEKFADQFDPVQLQLFEKDYVNWISFCEKNGLMGERGALLKALRDRETAAADLKQANIDLLALESKIADLKDQVLTADSALKLAELKDDKEKIETRINTSEKTLNDSIQTLKNANKMFVAAQAATTQEKQDQLEINGIYKHIEEEFFGKYDSRHDQMISIYSGNMSALREEKNHITYNGRDVSRASTNIGDIKEGDLYFYDAKTGAREKLDDPLVKAKLYKAAYVDGKVFANEWKLKDDEQDPKNTWTMTREADLSKQDIAKALDVNVIQEQKQIVQETEQDVADAQNEVTLAVTETLTTIFSSIGKPASAQPKEDLIAQEGPKDQFASNARDMGPPLGANGLPLPPPPTEPVKDPYGTNLSSTG